MDFLKPYLLLILTLLPTIAAVGLVAYHRLTKANDEALRRFALAASAVTALLSLLLIGWYDDPGLTINEPWVPSLGTHFHFGLDGMSLWLVLLATWMTPVAILAGWNAVKTRVREYLVCLLLLETGMVGVFVALDLILFYLFWEAVLVPMYFLVGVWGGERRIAAAVKFFVYTVIGSILMLAAMIALYFLHGKATGTYTFDLVTMTNALSARSFLSAGEQAWLFGAFALAFLIKAPVFPLHTWQPNAYAEAPTGAALLMAAVLSKMGTYGLMRFALPLFPEAAHRYAGLVMTLAVIGIIYGALVAMVQTDVKRLLAYSSLSHLGFIVLGIFSFTDKGLEGALFQMVAHGVTTGALFAFAGMLEERRRSTAIADFGGLVTPMPIFAALFVVACLASAGLPALNGFVGEFLVLLGAFAAEGGTAFAAFAATGMILSAVYLLWMVQRVVFGEADKAENRVLADLTPRELALTVPLVLLMFVMGCAPKLWLDRSHAAVEQVRAATARPTDQAQKGY